MIRPSWKHALTLYRILLHAKMSMIKYFSQISNCRVEFFHNVSESKMLTALVCNSMCSSGVLQRPQVHVEVKRFPMSMWAMEYSVGRTKAHLKGEQLTWLTCSVSTLKGFNTWYDIWVYITYRLLLLPLFRCRVDTLLRPSSVHLLHSVSVEVLLAKGKFSNNDIEHIQGQNWIAQYFLLSHPDSLRSKNTHQSLTVVIHPSKPCFTFYWLHAVRLRLSYLCLCLCCFVGYFLFESFCRRFHLNATDNE